MSDYVRFRSPHLLTAACLLLVCNYAAAIAKAQAPEGTGGFVERVYRDESGEHKFALFIPRDYDAARKWPAILYLHSAGERGNDGRSPLQAGLAPYVEQHADTFPFFVVFPQCEDVGGRALTGWLTDSPDGQRALKIFDSVLQEFSIDPKHQVLTGWSMGGYGTWSFAAAHPERWSAVVPLAGGGDVAWVEKLKDVPIWAFHGELDAAVRPTESRAMIDALRNAGGKPQYTEVPGVAHDVWRYAYGLDELYQWMLDPSKKTAPLAVKPGQRPALAPSADQKFVPALVVRNAMHIRLGNEMFDALGYSIPSRVSPNTISGNLANISDTTSASGYTFQVTLAGISYRGQLERAHVQAYRPDLLNLQLGVRNVQIVIGAAYMRGSGRSASAGPMFVTIGSRRPVWLSVDVTPYAENGKLRLRFVGGKFRIDNDNWYVTPPQRVSVSGFGMTRERVSSGLVEGLYGRKSQIEQQVVSAVPSMLRELEKSLDFPQINDVMTKLWPLPVYQPRVYLWPEAVSTDENGVSLQMGMTVAAIDSQKPPARVSDVFLDGNSVEALPWWTNLGVGINPRIFGFITNMLIQADVARIHVLDIPDRAFAGFVDREMLTSAIPDFAKFGDNVEVWSELVLGSPLTVAHVTQPQLPAEESASDGDLAESNGNTEQAPLVIQPPNQTRLRFGVSDIKISIAVRENPDAQWMPYAEFQYSLAQDAIAHVIKPGYARRALQLSWTGDPAIEATARFANGYTPADNQIHLDVVRNLFQDSWHHWTGSGPFSQADIADVDFGATKMRLQNVEWGAPNLYLTFGPPGVRITNRSDKILKYETRGPYSVWGGPFELKPGEFHEYPVSYPVTFRRRAESKYDLFTLPAGSHSIFWQPSPDKPLGLYLAKDPDLTLATEPSPEPTAAN